MRPRTCTQNIHNLFTRSHASEEENCTEIAAKIANVNGPLESDIVTSDCYIAEILQGTKRALIGCIPTHVAPINRDLSPAGRTSGIVVASESGTFLAQEDSFGFFGQLK
jgi:hypothetical protein